MKKVFFYALSLLTIMFLSSCKCPKCPDKCVDLTGHVAVRWDMNSKLVNVTVVNLGTLHAGPFKVYVNADENPVSPSNQLQIIHNINGLDPGASFNLQVSDFAMLATDENNALGNVAGITVIIDPKGAVAECDSVARKNNVIKVALPVNP